MEKWSQDVVDIEIVLHDNKVRFLVTHFSTPNHETAPTKSIPFQQVTIPATLVCAFYHQHC